MVSKDIIKIVQNFLQIQSDGIVGPNTMKAITQLSVIPSYWEKDRQVVGAVQFICSQQGIDAGPIDGLFGPQTDYGIDLLLEKEQTGTIVPWREDDPGKSTTSGKWPRQVQSELEGFYGPVGENQVDIISPYPLKIAWQSETIITRFSCHKKVKTSIENVLENVRDHYGLDAIKELHLDVWGGCFNVRQMRGGTQYSTHSWGIAIDWDPLHNKLRWGKDQAEFAKADYDFWWRCWENEGWVSLLRAKNYDAMHVQACVV